MSIHLFIVYIYIYIYTCMYVGTKSCRFDACMHLHLQRCVVFSCSADLNQESRRVAVVSVAWHQYVRQSLAISILHDIWDLRVEDWPFCGRSQRVRCMPVRLREWHVFISAPITMHIACLNTHVCMYVCMYVCVYVCDVLCASKIYIYIYTHILMQVYVYMYTYTYMFMFMIVHMLLSKVCMDLFIYLSASGCVSVFCSQYTDCTPSYSSDKYWPLVVRLSLCSCCNSSLHHSSVLARPF